MQKCLHRLPHLTLTTCFINGIVHVWDYIVQPLSHVRLFAMPWTAACQAPLSFTISLRWLTFMSIESMMLSNHLILCCLLHLLPSIFPSTRVFSNESARLKNPQFKRNTFRFLWRQVPRCHIVLSTILSLTFCIMGILLASHMSMCLSILDIPKLNDPLGSWNDTLL